MLSGRRVGGQGGGISGGLRWAPRSCCRHEFANLPWSRPQIAVRPHHHVTAVRPPAPPLRPSLVALSNPATLLPILPTCARHPPHPAAQGVQAQSEHALEEERLASARSAREEAQRQVEEAGGEAAAARREGERVRQYHEEEVVRT
ncbi:unnamed protein product [Closterium sp. Naga37s-1]|nr:unnamed protein product [Closterium sp. Naga37s-1]